ncbi:MAG: DUF1569 domain-containing protein [Ferruginibacter sp.]
MKSLFDAGTYSEITERLNKLTGTSKRQWGKMEVSQMLAHCKEAFKVPLSEKPLKGSLLLRMVASLFKSKLYNDSPWKQGLPTSPAFIVKDEKNFENEKQALSALVTKFYELGPEKVGNHPHPVFGSFTKQQWGQAMYKHLDHHLRQFGV